MSTGKPGNTNNGNSSTECVKVAVRCRPMNKKEITQGCQSIVEVDTQYNSLTLKKLDSGEIPKTFTYDYVYGIESTQQQIYDDCAFPLVESVLEGYNGTMFAYGQTGCGKTHTMMGNMNEEGNDQEKGIIPKSVRHIFGCIDASSGEKKFLVRCSYLEIYNESILDLLNHFGNNGKQSSENLKIKEDPNKGIFVQDLTNVIVKTVPELEKLLLAGIKNRKVGETAMNKDSSRSHSIFTIYIETAEEFEGGEQKFKAGKLNLVDLAGSERQSKTQATGDRLKEAQKINLSLSALGNVISALVDGKSTHIPYRDSKLTRLLQDSLGGNTKTVMIAAVSPADYNYDETLSTLRYASRAKSIQNKPKINEDPKDTLLRQYEEEIKALREILSKMQNGSMQFDPKVLMQNHAQSHTVESVDELIKKLEGQGKKIKIITEDEEDDKTPNKQNLKRKKSNKNQEISEQQKAEIENKLKQKEELLVTEQEQKQKLEQMLQDIEQKLVQGGNALEEKEREQAQKYREFQLKLKKQKQKEKKLLKEKLQKEEEMLLVEKSYKNLQEEVEEQRKVIEKLRNKYQQSDQEVKDLEKEHQIQKESLLETIREQQYDVKFYKKIAKMILKDEEIAKLKHKSNYEDDDWIIPNFVLRAKEVCLPKVNGRQMMEKEKEERELEIQQDEINGGGS